MELASGFFFASLVLSWCPVLFSNIFFCCFLTLEKLKIANKASCDKGARFLQGLLFKYLLCICCLELLNMHWKSDFRSTFCVDLGHFIPSLCRAEQIGRSVRCFEQTRNRLSFRKDLCCKPPVIFCQLRASKQNLSLCCCVLLYFCPQAALRSLQHSHRCRCTTDSVCVFHRKREKKECIEKENRKKLLVHTALSLSCNSAQPGLQWAESKRERAFWGRWQRGQVKQLEKFRRDGVFWRKRCECLNNKSTLTCFLPSCTFTGRIAASFPESWFRQG